jgi:hypothetical protein
MDMEATYSSTSIFVSLCRSLCEFIVSVGGTPAKIWTEGAWPAESSHTWKIEKFVGAQQVEKDFNW